MAAEFLHLGGAKRSARSAETQNARGRGPVPVRPRSLVRHGPEFGFLRLHGGRSRRKPSGAVARELDQAGPDDEIILPPIVPEGQLENLRRKIGSLIARGARVFRLTSFFQFALFPAETRERLVLKTMFPFPVCNSQTVEVCREFGASGVQAWIELGHDDFAALRSHSVLPLEAYVSGRPCIFMTRAVLPQRPARIRDICGNGFELEEQRSGLTVLYPEETLNIPLPEGYSGFYDHRKSWGEEGKETEFNFTRGWA